MKKLRLITVFILLFLFTLFGCKETTDTEKTGNNDDPNSKTALEYSSSDTMDYLSSLKIDGYKLTYQISLEEDGRKEDTTISIGVSGDVYYISTLDTESHISIYDLSGTSFITYQKDGEDELWYKDEVPFTTGFTKEVAKASFNQTIAAFNVYITYYQTLPAGQFFEKGSTTKIAGRNCTEYTYSNSSLGASLSYKLYIDDTTGLCFKVETIGTAMGEVAKVNLTCTEFLTSYKITFPKPNEIHTGNEPYEPGDGEEDEDLIQISTPVVTINDTGVATWSINTGVATSYSVIINGEVTVFSTTSTNLNPGDTIKVMAIGDGVTYEDSEWSSLATYTKEEVYDFSDLDLPENITSVLIAYEEREPGTYLNNKIYKCTNGDIIAYRGSSWIDMCSRENGYKCITLVSNYGNDTETKKTTDYEYTDYNTNKKAYYNNLALVCAGINYFDKENDETYASIDDFVEKQTITLLEYNEYEKENLKAYELEKYTIFSGEINKKYFNTIYLHETRSLDYLKQFSDKIEYWSVARTNIDDNYTDWSIEVHFKDTFKYDHYKTLIDTLKTKGLTPKEGFSYPTVSTGYDIFEGYLSVYTFPYEDSDDELNDEYKIYGGESLNTNYVLSVKYTYLTWYDGGTFATYVVERTGLWRYVDGFAQLMIDANGEVQKHIKAPFNILDNFSIVYTTDVEDDQECIDNDYFVETNSVEKVNDVIIHTRVAEYDTTYTIGKMIDGVFYYIEGYKDDEGYHFDDVYSGEGYVDVSYDLYEILSAYFINQFKAEKTSDTQKIAGISCTKYVCSLDDEIYQYFVSEDGLTLKVFYDSDYPQTSLIKSLQTSITDFSKEALDAINASNILNYVPEED